MGAELGTRHFYLRKQKRDTVTELFGSSTACRFLRRSGSPRKNKRAVAHTQPVNRARNNRLSLWPHVLFRSTTFSAEYVGKRKYQTQWIRQRQTLWNMPYPRCCTGGSVTSPESRGCFNSLIILCGHCLEVCRPLASNLLYWLHL